VGGKTHKTMRVLALQVLIVSTSLLGGADAFRAPSSANPIGSRMGCSGIRAAVSASCPDAPSLTRRSFGRTCFAFGAAIALRAPEKAHAEFPRISSLSQADFESWELDDDSGLRVKEIAGGLGARAVEEGDKLRVRYSVYLQDGTIVSRGQVRLFLAGVCGRTETVRSRERTESMWWQGVEQEFTLGKKQVPAGLEDGVRDMKVGAERLLLVPPEIGWSSKYRAAALQQIKSCGGSCPLDEQSVVVFVKLEGYKKRECLGVGDLPISANVDTEKGTISLTIGSDTCPEGNIEVTEKRLKALDMLNKLKDEGRLKAEEKQKFVIP